MNAVLTFTKSSIGKKWIVALTGLAMFLFVIAHAAGNLQFFLGPEALNHYGEVLRFWPELLWVARIGLLVCLVLHVIFALLLVIENRKARPQKYEFKASVQSKLSTKLMAVTGLLLLGFVIFHLAHYTWHTVDSRYTGFHDAKGRHDIYRMIVVGFSNVPTSLFYIVAMSLLSSHLSHGAWSWLQTVGLRTKKIAGETTRGASIIAVILALAFISIPIAVLVGCGRGYEADRRHAEQAEKQAASPETVITPKEAK